MTTLGRAASLGDTLRNIRESKDMTLRAAATATGISNAYISQIETGRIVTPSPDFLRRFAHGYGVSYDELMRVAGYADATHDATPIVPPPILGRTASLRVAYASAVQDVQRLTEENARLKEQLDTITDRSRAMNFGPCADCTVCEQHRHSGWIITHDTNDALWFAYQGMVIEDLGKEHTMLRTWLKIGDGQRREYAEENNKLSHDAVIATARADAADAGILA